jgi:sugar O-acyltransferase (sialic acid O-acetyltransferase NeuD family)
MSGIRHPEVVVIGGGGHAKVVASTVQASGMKIVAILDDDPAKSGQTILGVPVVGGADGYMKRQVFPAILAVGDNRVRRELARRFEGLEWATAVHPTAYVHPSVELGPGTVVFAGAVVQPEVKTGRHVIVNTGVTVDHDCHLGDFVHLAPGVHLAGNVTVGAGALLGIGSVAKPGVRIGSWATVGAGAVVISDLADHLTAVGVPARALSDIHP